MNPMIFVAATFILSAPALAMPPVISPIITPKSVYKTDTKKVNKHSYNKENFQHKFKHKKNICC